MQLSLGPILYLWERDAIFEFYKNAADMPVDIVYLGETVCSKRRPLKLDDWIGIGRELQQSGKQVVLSTLALLEAESELRTVQRIADNGEFMVEANDMSAVNMAQGNPFVSGPHINCYNSQTLAFLNSIGACRWVMPVELSAQSLKHLQENRPANMQTEVFAFGRMPLAFSARCFTARAEKRTKDDCEFICGKYENGIPLYTQEDKEFLCLNGIQIQSASYCNLISEIDELRAVGVDVLRLSPQIQGMMDIVSAYRNVLDNKTGIMEAESGIGHHLTSDTCNGYWHGKAGMEWYEEMEKLTRPA